MTSDRVKGISIEELPEIYREVAGVLGLEAAIALSERFGGQLLYFPKLDGLLRAKRDEAIRAEFTGKNYRELAKKYGISEQQVRRVVSSKAV